MSNLQDLKPNELASIIFGFSGFIFGLLGYLNARRSDQRARSAEQKAEETAVRQERDKLLNYAVAAEGALMSIGRRLHEIETESRERDLADLSEEVSGLLTSLDKQLVLVRTGRAEAEKQLPPREQWPSLLSELSEAIITLRPLSDRQSLEDENGIFIDRARAIIRKADEYKHRRFSKTN